MGRVLRAFAFTALITALPLALAEQARAEPSPTPQGGNGGLGVDPCAMLSAPDVASVLGVGVRSLSAAQHPSPNECAWAVASRAGAPVQDVLLVMQPVQAGTAPCRGFGCLGIARAVLGSRGLPGLPPQFADAFTDAQLIAGLGERASWKDGRLTVVRADTAFQLLVHGSGPATLTASEALARDVLYRIATP